jgi:putative serine protease PepD
MSRSISLVAALLAATALAVVGLGTLGAGKPPAALGDPTSSPDVTTASASQREALYSHAAPGVVDITATSTKVTHAVSPFRPFGEPRKQTAKDAGAGFFVDDQGDIVTAAHVVEKARSITVQLQDGVRRPAKLLGEDNSTDLAVLNVDPSGLSLHVLPLGDSSQLAIGQGVAAIGDPFGYDRSFSTGIVSGLDRTIQAPDGFTVAHAIQTDTSLNPGNSGGPVLNAAGQVIGIADQIATDGADQNSGVGFAVPADLLKSELSNLEAGRAVAHAYLGVESADATGAREGALIAQVVGGSPARSAGLEAGDLVTSIDGKPVTGSGDVTAAISELKPGDHVTVAVERHGHTLSFNVTLGTQPKTGVSNG